MVSKTIQQEELAANLQAKVAESRLPNIVIEASNLSVYYGSFQAVRDATFSILLGEITAFIGPSGCGKSTIIRSLNRMNDLVPSARVVGSVKYRGLEIYGPLSDAGEVRRRIGMVFQKPNPFPKSIYENVAFGPRVNGKVSKSTLDGIVEENLKKAALWGEVKDRLKSSAFSLSGGQQQRLCIARALAVGPDVLLMDEPCSALDPIATGKIEDLMQGLKAEYPIVIVTHNMQQASRISDYTAFFSVEVGDESARPTGVLVEHDRTVNIFSRPSDERTLNYVTGRMG